MKQTVEICDNCKEGIARTKCHICNKDICDGCGKVVYFEQVNIYDYFMAIRKANITKNTRSQNEFLTVCNECEQKINHFIKGFFLMKNPERKILMAEVIDLLMKRLPEIVIADKI